MVKLVRRHELIDQGVDLISLQKSACMRGTVFMAWYALLLLPSDTAGLNGRGYVMRLEGILVRYYQYPDRTDPQGCLRIDTRKLQHFGL